MPFAIEHPANPRGGGRGGCRCGRPKNRTGRRLRIARPPLAEKPDGPFRDNADERGRVGDQPSWSLEVPSSFTAVVGHTTKPRCAATVRVLRGPPSRRSRRPRLLSDTRRDCRRSQVSAVQPIATPAAERHAARCRRRQRDPRPVAAVPAVANTVCRSAHLPAMSKHVVRTVWAGRGETAKFTVRSSDPTVLRVEGLHSGVSFALIALRRSPFVISPRPASSEIWFERTRERVGTLRVRP